MKKRFDLTYVDKTYWVLYIALAVVAVIALFSAGSTLVYERHSILGPVASQMFFLCAGIVVAFFLQFVPSRYIRMGGYFFLGISLLCLWSMLIPGNPLVATINGASRWIRIGGFTFQPSELAKLSLIIVVADLLSRIRTEEDKRKYFYWTLGLTAATALPIMTGNLSTAILLGGIVLILWFLARIPWKYILSTIGIAIVLLVAGYAIVEFGFVRSGKTIERGPFKRAITWVNRVDDIFAEHADDSAEFKLTDDNYQRSIAKVAVARGGRSPFGVLPGNSQERDYLPQAFADYIFAIIVEESGVFGALVLIFLYMAVLFRACQTSSRFGDYAALLMVMGLALMLTCQALVSMMVAVGLGPVTGQPLPLISRGGTSALITSAYFGIIMSVSREQRELSERQNITTKESLEDVPEITLE